MSLPKRYMSIGSANADEKDIMDTTLSGIDAALSDSDFSSDDFVGADDSWMKPFTLDEARQLCSQSKPDDVLRLVLSLETNLASPHDLFQLLGEQWAKFPALWGHVDQIRCLLKSAPEEHLLAMMTREELAVRDDLPAEFDVYRGCYHSNIQGLTWSLEREEAAAFPYTRINRMEAPPLLVAARLRRRQTVVKVGPSGVTVIGWKPMLQGTELLQPLSF